LSHKSENRIHSSSLTLKLLRASNITIDPSPFLRFIAGSFQCLANWKRHDGTCPYSRLSDKCFINSTPRKSGSRKLSSWTTSGRGAFGAKRSLVGQEESCGVILGLIVHIVEGYDTHRGDRLRTNIVIDEELIREAQKLTALPTKKAVVDEALRTLIRLKKQQARLADRATSCQ
jgi:Arc/MetJ family transcription regulator